MISGGSQRRAGASGPPNITIDIDGDGNLFPGPALGVLTINGNYFGDISTTINVGNATFVVLALDGISASTANILNGQGSISFTGTFSGLELNFSNCTQLPTIPTGCAVYHALGTTSTTTLVSSTVLPHDLVLGELTTPITAVDFSAGSSVETSDIVEWDLDSQALDASSINAILAFCVAHGGDNGNLTLNGGTNAAPSGQGILDVATLIGRGWTVTTN